jgi:hypothetical protein
VRAFGLFASFEGEQDDEDDDNDDDDAAEPSARKAVEQVSDAAMSLSLDLLFSTI